MRIACIQTVHELAAPGVQSPKREEILRWNAATHHLLIFIIFLKACDNVIRVTNIFLNS